MKTPPPAEPQITRCEHNGKGEVYDVGPGKKYERLGQVPFATLEAGDMVRVHWRKEPYRDALLLSSQGRPDRPIRLCGVRGPQGERPVIDANGAVISSEQALPKEWAGMGLILVNRKQNDDWETYAPAHLRIEGLHLRGAREGARFYLADGTPDSFGRDSACISILRGMDVTLRDNEIEDCGFGIFVKSSDMAPERVSDLLIEGNYLHDNNPSTDWSVHSLYLQGFGVTVQFNHLGVTKFGNNLKDRSVGAVIRYNWIEPSAAHLLDLVEAEEHKKTAVLDPRYRQTFVYGNVMKHLTSSSVVHYGGDHQDQVAYFRKGELFFFNNTVVIADRPGEEVPWGQGVFVVETVDERVRAFNNIIDYRGSAQAFELMAIKEIHAELEQGGYVILGKNWLPQRWERCNKDENPYYRDRLKLGADQELGVLEGANAVICQPSEPLLAGTFQPTPELANAGEALSAALVAAGHDVSYEYDPELGDPKVPLTQIRRRVPRGNALALGALEERE